MRRSALPILIIACVVVAAVLAWLVLQRVFPHGSTEASGPVVTEIRTPGEFSKVDASGAFELIVPPGDLVIEVRKRGYRPVDPPFRFGGVRSSAPTNDPPQQIETRYLMRRGEAPTVRIESPADGDRVATEVCLAATSGREVPGWARDALPLLPEVMEDSGRRAKAADRATVDRVEAWLLGPRVGEVFDVAVVEHDEERDRSTVALDDPAVRARCDGRPPLGERIAARLVEADPTTGTVRFTPA